MKKNFFFFSISLLFLQANSTMEEVYLKNACNSCHGMYGEGMGAAPRLQGQRENVLLRKLRNLQKGKTRTAFGTIMISFAKTLDQNQTVEMAKYLSTLKRVEPEETYELESDNSGDGSS
ncbi:c-type cytochrome [Sulfurovum sp.]|uniref:c-type cytochrome n=1 Tax=Sulfurovum sp. TaxID=1969726 RepID=UPI0025FF90EE|nr:c-type cytochrome [Sulfurovum sp.]